jgi:hypothetical protein
LIYREPGNRLPFFCFNQTAWSKVVKELKMNSKGKLPMIPAGILCALISSFPAPAQAADSFIDIFKEGKAGLAFRYRFENVDQERFTKDATAGTLRTRLNFRTADIYGISAFAEYDFVMTAGWNNYNAGAGNTRTVPSIR